MREPVYAFKSSPARVELRKLYAEADALVADVTCENSGDCCRFAVTGLEPYPTAIERAEIELAIAQGGIKIETKARKRLPLAQDELACPMLSKEGRCRIYTSRPLGCRTFFCERAKLPGDIEVSLPRREFARIARDVADLAARFDPRDPQPRPLSRVLGLR